MKIVLDHMDNVNKSKQFQMWKNIMNAKDSKAVWGTINWNEPSEISREPDIDDLMNHFKAQGKSCDESTLLCEVTGITHVPVMDDVVTIDEVKDAYNSNRWLGEEYDS